MTRSILSFADSLVMKMTGHAFASCRGTKNYDIKEHEDWATHISVMPSTMALLQSLIMSMRGREEEEICLALKAAHQPAPRPSSVPPPCTRSHDT